MTGVTLPNESKKINEMYTSLLPRSADDHAGVPGHNSTRAPTISTACLLALVVLELSGQSFPKIDELNLELSREKKLSSGCTKPKYNSDC